jgi:hypothetical protein
LEVNSSPTTRFLILARTETPIDSVVRVDPHKKYEYRGFASVELGFSQKYGFQVILVSFAESGKFAQEINTDYAIDRARTEIPIPSAMTLHFLRDLMRNTKDAIKQVKDWERGRGL